MKRRSIIIIAVVLAVALSYLSLAGASSRAVESTYAKGLRAGGADAKVSGTLFSGHTEEIALKLTFDEESLLPYSSMEAEWGPSDTVLALMKNGQGAEKECAPQRLILSWDDEALARYFQDRLGIINEAQVKIEDSYITLSGKMTLAGEDASLVIEAVPTIDEKGRLYWEMQSLTSPGKNYSRTMEEKIAEAMAISPDMSPLEWEINLDEVSISNGNMIVYGSADQT